MAEERIAIHICSGTCRCLREVKEGYSIVNGLSNGTYCSAYIHGTWQKIDPEKDCKNCKRAEYNGISRSEAIERMAKVEWMTTVCLRNNIFADKITKEKWEEEWKKLKRSYKDIYLKSAEAALDALIKGEVK